jgi:hypothetical protein
VTILTNTMFFSQVMASNTLARKVVLVSSTSHVGLVDRAHLDDVIFRTRTSNIVYHSLKTFGRGKRAVQFIVFVAKSTMFSQDLFYALQGKSNWGADKISWVDLTLDMCVAAASVHANLIDTHLTASSNVYEVPSDAKIHRIKYLASFTQNDNADDAKAAIIKTIAGNTTDMGKQTKIKTVQHIIDYAQDAIFVGVVDGIRVIDAVTMTPLSAGIVPSWIVNCEAIDLEDLMSDPNALKLLKKAARVSRSPSPIRSLKSKGKVRDCFACSPCSHFLRG